MTNRRAGGYALIGIAVVTIVIFLIHPSRVDHALVMGLWGVNSITHALALAYVPAMALGFVALAEWLGLDRPVVRLALAFNLLAVVLMTLAPLVSGFIVPSAFAAGDAAGQLAVLFNRAFDRGYVGFTAAAMLLNAFAFPRGHILLKILTFPAALGPLAWLASGQFNPDVHAMLVLAIVQGGWFVSAGWALLADDRLAQARLA
jgi:hypothetical protein